MRVHLFVASDPADFDRAIASRVEALWLEHPVATAQRPATPAFYVRLTSRNAAADDGIDAAMAAAPHGIVAPVGNGVDVQHFGVKLAVREAELGLDHGTTKIVAVIAAPAALLRPESFTGISSRLAGLAFDARAFAASLGIADLSASPLRLARDLTLLAAKAAGVAAIFIDPGQTPGGDTAALRDGFDAIAVHDLARVAAIRAEFKCD